MSTVIVGGPTPLHWHSPAAVVVSRGFFLAFMMLGSVAYLPTTVGRKKKETSG
jgi:hypothetical protein